MARRPCGLIQDRWPHKTCIHWWTSSLRFEYRCLRISVITVDWVQTWKYEHGVPASVWWSRLLWWWAHIHGEWILDTEAGKMYSRWWMSSRNGGCRWLRIATYYDIGYKHRPISFFPCYLSILILTIHVENCAIHHFIWLVNMISSIILSLQEGVMKRNTTYE